jgi:hypothetical protein
MRNAVEQVRALDRAGDPPRDPWRKRNFSHMLQVALVGALAAVAGEQPQRHTLVWAGPSRDEHRLLYVRALENVVEPADWPREQWYASGDPANVSDIRLPVSVDLGPVRPLGNPSCRLN